MLARIPLGSARIYSAVMQSALGMPAVRRAPWTATTTLTLSAVTIVAIALLLTLGADALNPIADSATVIAIGLLQIVLALIVLRFAPGNAVAVLLAAQGFIVIVTNAPRGVVIPALGGSWMLLYLPLALLLLVVPTGHPRTRRWRGVGIALGVVVTSFLLLVAVQTLWPPADEPLAIAGTILLVAFLGLLIACAVAPFVRYRAADELERMRLRWVLIAGLSLPLTLMLCWASYLILGTAALVGFGLIAILLAIPLGTTIALTRPQLFDIDRATSAGVTALALFATGLTVLTLLSVSIGRPMSEWATIPAAATTATVTLAGVVAFAFARRGFERILFPDRGRAISGLRHLSRRVDAGSAPPEEIEEVLRRALRDRGLTVTYRRLADRALVGLDGASQVVNDATAVVRVRGEEIGAIIPSATRVKRPSVSIARAAAPLLDAVRSRSELANAAAELEASRERLLRAGYEERRRLERDLHDGAQQRLVALGMQLRVLQRTVAQDPAIADGLDAAVAQLGTAVAELRRLAHGVRPSALDDGLGTALAELERISPDVIELDVRAGELPDAVAVTAYYVVSEAVANALRHAEPSRIHVHVRHVDGVLRVRVADDGCGGAIARATGGLTGLSDRVSTLGGALRLTSDAGTGTTIEAVLPCAS